MSFSAGYGRGGWSSGKYGQPNAVSVTGVSATGAVGSVTITEGTGISTAVTGLAGTGAVGSVTITQGTGVTVSATGVAGTGAVGSVAVSTDNTIAVTGVAATGEISSVTAVIPKTVNVTGVAATGAVGSVTVTEGTGVTVSATGVSATGSVGSVTVTGGAIASVTGIAATGAVGSVTVATDSVVSAVGVSALGRINNVTVNFDFVVSVTGVSAEVVTSGAQVWGLITPDQTPSYSAITPSQSPSFSAITPSQSPSFTEIVPGSEVNTFTVTVGPKTGGGNAFYIDGVERPVLTLLEGSIYRFDTSSSTTASHPFRLSTTSDGTHGGGSIYTDGVTIVGTQGQSGSYLQITVASGAPTLHYFCTVHSGMGNQININALFTEITPSQTPDWQDIAA